MRKPVQVRGIACLAAALCAMSAAASSISVNSTCVAGTCSSSDVLALGATSSNPFNFTYTFANSDRYLLTGTLSVENLNTSYMVSVSDLIATFEGNGTGTSSGQDVLQADFFQNIEVRRGGSSNAYESIGGTFGSGLANASSASGEFFVAGQGLGMLGPYYASSSSTFSGSKTGTVLLPAGTPRIDYQYTLTFAEGSRPGSSIGINPSPVSVTPEPGSLMLLSTGLAGMAAAWRRRRPVASA